jgi:beta-glucosidase
LKGFKRVTLNPGQAQAVQFTLTTHDLAHWDNAANNWVATAGGYQIQVGDSSRSLPVSGTLTVGATVTGGVAGIGPITGQGPVTITNPHGMSSRLGAAASLQLTGDAGLTFTATGLPPGFSINAAGLISGTGTAAGTSTVTVTGTAASGARSSVTFVWNIA